MSEDKDSGVCTFILTPDAFKDFIDDAVKNHGAKAFVISTARHGTAHAPSSKVNLYRIPSAVHGGIYRDNNLPRVLSHSLLVLTVDNLRSTESHQGS